MTTFQEQVSRLIAVAGIGAEALRRLSDLVCDSATGARQFTDSLEELIRSPGIFQSPSAFRLEWFGPIDLQISQEQE
jgi:hypothetical protein